MTDLCNLLYLLKRGMNTNAEQAAPNLIKNQNMDGGVCKSTKNKRDRSSNRDSTFDHDF